MSVGDDLWTGSPAQLARFSVRQSLAQLSITRDRPALLVARRSFDRGTVDLVRAAIADGPIANFDVVLVSTGGSLGIALEVVRLLKRIACFTTYLPLPLSGPIALVVLAATRIVLGPRGGLGPIVGLGRPGERSIRRLLAGRDPRLIRHLIGGRGRLGEAQLRAWRLPVRRPRALERGVMESIAEAVIENRDAIDLVELFDWDAGWRAADGVKS